MRCSQTGLSVSYAFKRGCRCPRCKSYKKTCTKKDLKNSRERARRWRKKHPVRIKKLRRKSVDKRWIEKFGSLQLKQKGKCAICLKKPRGLSNSRTRLNVDHDHRTGKIRGLLCGSCNVGLGHFGDNPTILLSAIKYLQKHNKRKW